MNSAVWAFMGIMALAQFSPGPDMLLLTRTALTNGRLAAILCSLGISCGLLVHSALAYTGAWVWMEKFPNAIIVFRIVSAMYLCYLAIRMFQPAKPDDPNLTISHKRAYLQGFLCNLFNPKAAIVIAALSAPFLTKNLSPILLGSITVVQGCVLWCLWSVFLPAPKIRTLYQSYQRHISVLFGCIMLLLAIQLLIA